MEINKNINTQKRKKLRLTRPWRLMMIALGAFALCLCAFFGTRAIQQAARKGDYTPLTAEEINYALLRGQEGETDESRLGVAKTGVTLVGKVHYFWGGKSTCVGEDPKWGEPTEVTGAGSESTGTVRPYGLDCSGFVAWCFIQQGLSAQEVEEQVGFGTWNQWDKTTAISWKDLRVGDFVFQNAYPTNKGNHIGICVGFTEKGKPLFVHCASGFDNVVVTGAGDVFHYARRPNIFGD